MSSKHSRSANKVPLQPAGLLVVVVVVFVVGSLSLVECQTSYTNQPLQYNYNNNNNDYNANNGRLQLVRAAKPDQQILPQQLPQQRSGWSRALPVQAGQLSNNVGANGGPVVQPARDTRDSSSSSSSLDRDDELGATSGFISNNSKRHISYPQANGSANTMSSSSGTAGGDTSASQDDICADRLCYGLPMGCLTSKSPAQHTMALDGPVGSPQSQCSVLVTSKRFIDPDRPVARDIMFELIATPEQNTNNYAAVGFSHDGKMAGSLVSECLQYHDTKVNLQVVMLAHSYNSGPTYENVPARIKSGIKNLGVSFENGRYQCRWIVESAVEFSYEALNGSTIFKREDLGYKNYHIILATGEYNVDSEKKSYHRDRASSMTPISLAQTGHIKSLGAHILVRIHGSLMIVIWMGLVTISIVMARYYKNEWSNSKLSNLAIWFVVHRTLMMVAWFGSVIAVIFAFMYTESYHPGLHQVSGSICLLLSTVQVCGGFLRPSQESSKRVYFNWTHFLCGNISYLAAMVSLVTAAFLVPAHLPPIYIWIVAMFVGFYSLTHIVMTIHQFVVHKSSKISITPMSDLNSQSSATYTDACGFVADTYHKDANSLRQFMMGVLVTIVVIFIVSLVSLVNIS